MITAEQVQQWLQELGNTPDEVAASLEKQGIKGWPRAACDCPITKYLQSKGCYKVATCHSYSHVWVDKKSYTSAYADPVEVKYAWGNAVRQFIDAFDKNAYPQLVKEEADDN